MVQHDRLSISYSLIEINGVVVGLEPCFCGEEVTRLTSHMDELQNMIEAVKLLEHLGGDTKGPAAAFLTWKSRMQEELDAIRGRRDAIYRVDDCQPLEGDNGQVNDDNDARLTGLATTSRTNVSVAITRKDSDTGRGPSISACFGLR
jgi:hypothetical protein